MTSVSTSITNANPGPLLYAALETALLAENFVLVDTVTISTRVHKILKSPAVENVVSKDWYLDITYNATGVTDGLTMRTFEGYTAATDLAVRGPGLGRDVVSDVFDYTTWSWAGANAFALETNWEMTGSRLSTTTSAMAVRASVTPDRVIVGLGNSNTSLLYAGLYEPDDFFAAQAGSASFPLFCGVVGGGSQSFFGYLTRLPMVADGEIPFDDFDLFVNGTSFINARWLSQTFLATPDSTRAWFYVGWPVYLIKPGDYPYGGTLLGKLLDVRYTRGTSGGSVAFGDTVNITTNPALTGGNEHVITQRNTHMYMYRNL